MDIVCSQLTSSLFRIIGTLVLGTALALFFKFYIEFSKYVTVSAISISVLAFVAIFDTICVLPNAKEAFKDDYDVPSISCYMERKLEVDLLMQLIQPSTRHPGGYFLLEGLHGSGKSTILQQSVLPYTKSGIVHLHIKVSTNGDDTDSLYSALKVQEYCDSKWATLCSYPSHTCQNDPVARLEYVLKVLTVAASEIHREDGIPPLVVFDNTAQILTKPVQK